MDRAAITELFEYNEFAWRAIISDAAHLGDDILTKPAPGSGWPALGNCLGHILFAYNVWIDALQGEPRTLEQQARPAITWSEAESWNGATRARFRAYLNSLSDQQLHTDLAVSVYGETVAYTPAEILGNTVLHERGHHGDVNTLFYQHGLLGDAGVPDYRWFVNEQRGYR